MGKHRAVSPDFVSRQEAATRLMLSLRQVDRLLTKGLLPRTKVSANRTGIWRVAFDAYLAAMPPNRRRRLRAKFRCGLR